MDSEQRKADPFHLQTIDIPTEFRAQLVKAEPPVIPAERLLDTSPPNAGITRPGSEDGEKQFDAMRLQSIDIPSEFRAQLVHAKPPVIPRERLLDTSSPGALEWKDGVPSADASGERAREPAAAERESEPEWPKLVVRYGALFLIGAAVVGVFVWWSRATTSSSNAPDTSATVVATDTTAATSPTNTEQLQATAAPIATTASTGQPGSVATATPHLAVAPSNTTSSAAPRTPAPTAGTSSSSSDLTPKRPNTPGKPKHPWW